MHEHDKFEARNENGTVYSDILVLYPASRQSIWYVKPVGIFVTQTYVRVWNSSVKINVYVWNVVSSGQKIVLSTFFFFCSRIFSPLPINRLSLTQLFPKNTTMYFTRPLYFLGVKNIFLYLAGMVAWEYEILHNSSCRFYSDGLSQGHSDGLLLFILSQIFIIFHDVRYNFVSRYMLFQFT